LIDKKTFDDYVGG